MSNTILLKKDLFQLLGLGFRPETQAHKHNPKSEKNE